MRLHFQSFGQGEPLIVLHGLFGSGDNWVPFAREVSSRFHVILPDARNHGLSPHTSEMGFAAMANDVKHLIEDQGLKSAHVLGHSMGGKTAMEVALAHGERVSKLVVADIAPRPYSPPHERILQALCGLDLGQYNDRRQIEETLAAAIPDLVVRRFLLKSLTRDRAGSLQWRLGLEEIRDNYDQLNGGVAGGRVWSGPCLFVRGENSDYMEDSDLTRIRELFPAAGMRTIPGAGHWVHADAPKLFRAVVEEFLD